MGKGAGAGGEGGVRGGGCRWMKIVSVMVRRGDGENGREFSSTEKLGVTNMHTATV